MEAQKLNNNKILIILLIIFGIIILGLGGYIAYDKLNTSNNPQENNNEDEENKEIQLKKGTFKISKTDGMGGYGNLQVEGYATVEKRLNCDEFCEGNEEEVSYVFFNITRIENEDFFQVFDNSGNSFIAENAIGLGCVHNNILVYYNDSVENGYKEYKLPTSNTTKILNSTKENPIILELDRLEMQGGSGAPSCYSHITTISIP